MSILAIDTSSMVSSVAVAREERLLSEIIVENRLTHSETLLVNVEKALLLAEVDKKDLQAVAVSIGPGSFTGLRIGLAAAKGIAYGLRLPIIGIPTGEALAWHYPVAGVEVAPFIDAQKGNVYTGVYTWQEGRIKELMAMRAMSLPEALELCEKRNLPVMAVGDMVRKKLIGREALPENLHIPPAHMLMPRAANVAMAAIERFKREEFSSLMELEPIYIRRSEAEDLWEKRHKEV